MMAAVGLCHNGGSGGMMSQWWQRWDEVTNGGSGRMSNGSGGMMSQEWQRWDDVTMVVAVGSCHIGGSGG